MKIAMFTSGLPEAGRKPGGVDVLIVRVANALVDAGHDVRIYSFAPRPPELKAQVVTLWPARLRHSRLARMFLLPLILNFVRFEGDVLHLHGDDWFLFRRRLPTVRTFYGSARDEARTATSLKRRVSQRVIYGLELVSSRLATGTYSLLPEDGVEYGSLGALNCGATPSAVTERTPFPSILFVGTWRGRKRGEWLAKEFKRAVLPEHPNAELWMVSTDAETAPSVRQIPAPSDRELEELYRACWVFCLPSTYEGFGIPYLEAMAAGTPVVATQNPGAEYLLEGGRAGLIVDDVALGGELSRLLSDEEARRELATAGRRRSGDFSWAQTVARYLAAYERAISRWHDRDPPRSDR